MTNDLTRELQDNELDAVTGGFNSISEVIGGIGKALESVARGDGGATIVIFGVELPLPPPPPPK
jgi:hypothetical protein